MKILKCDLCDVTAQGETFEEWMKALQPHYMEAHADFMKNPNHTQEDREKWMKENKARFDAVCCGCLDKHIYCEPDPR